MKLLKVVGKTYWALGLVTWFFTTNNYALLLSLLGFLLMFL
jgi:hypothetical protein